MKELIKYIEDKNKFKIIDCSKITNSFNSLVYLVNTTDVKYILKIYKNDLKRVVESDNLSLLKDIIKVAELIDSDKYLDYSYNLMSYIEGDNYLDEDYLNISDDLLFRVGSELKKFHLSDESNDIILWVDYLINCLDLVDLDISNYLGYYKNKMILDYLKDYINTKIILLKKLNKVHMDFRIGNLIIKDNDIYFIDFESVKYGDYVFDFSKSSRSMSIDKFNLILNGYKREEDIKDRLDFYVLFDSYTSLYFSIKNNNLDSDFYYNNMRVVEEFLEKKGIS